MKDYLKIIVLLILVILIPISSAAGSGGGGSSKKPTCTEDLWTCTDFGECSSDGMQSRKCTHTVDCASADTTKPSEKESCVYVSQVLSSLKCGNLKTMRDRVHCRLGLEESELQKELEIRYLPEECRSIPSINERENCVLLYARSQKCWHLSIGEERMNCLRDVLDLKNIKDQKDACKNNSACLSSLRKNVYSLIKFRLYDLEERAEELIEKGIITTEQAADIISALEEKKLEFNKATTKEQRKQVIQDVKLLWREFIAQIKK